MFSGKGALKMRSKFSGEHPCRGAISIKLFYNCIEIALRRGCSQVNLVHIFGTGFPKNFSGGLGLMVRQSTKANLTISSFATVIIRGVL